MALVAYDDSESDDNEEAQDYNRPPFVSTKTATEKQTVKIGLPFNNLVSLKYTEMLQNNCIVPKLVCTLWPELLSL